MPHDTHPFAVMTQSKDNSMECTTFLAENVETLIGWISNIPPETRIIDVMLEGISCKSIFSRTGQLMEYLTAS